MTRRNLFLFVLGLALPKKHYLCHYCGSKGNGEGWGVLHIKGLKKRDVCPLCLKRLVVPIQF